jgi:hypothetical protein
MANKNDLETLRALLWRLQNSNGKPWNIHQSDVDKAAAALNRLETAARPFWVRVLNMVANERQAKSK